MKATFLVATPGPFKYAIPDQHFTDEDATSAKLEKRLKGDCSSLGFLPVPGTWSREPGGRWKARPNTLTASPCPCESEAQKDQTLQRG